MIVADASIIVDSLVEDGPAGDRKRARIQGERGHAPELLDVEVIHALRRLQRRGELDDRRAEQALYDLATLPFVRTPHRYLTARAWELRHNLTSYDAVYVALAEALDAPLLTTDAALARAPGLACEVELLA